MSSPGIPVQLPCLFVRCKSRPSSKKIVDQERRWSKMAVSCRLRVCPVLVSFFVWCKRSPLHSFLPEIQNCPSNLKIHHHNQKPQKSKGRKAAGAFSLIYVNTGLPRGNTQTVLAEKHGSLGSTRHVAFHAASPAMHPAVAPKKFRSTESRL